MNENEAAEQFNRNLDAALAGGRRVSSGSDLEAMETAAGFIRADFSGESAIKDALRARLAGDAPHFGPFGKSAGQAALALACLVLVVAVLMRPGGRRAAAPDTARSAVEAASSGGSVSAVQTADARSAQARPGVARQDGERSDPGLFRSVPMARLAGERLENFPIETKAGGSPIVVVQGRKVALPDGTGVVWETEDAVFTLESREISPEDLFQRKTL